MDVDGIGQQSTFISWPGN